MLVYANFIKIGMKQFIGIILLSLVMLSSCAPKEERSDQDRLYIVTTTQMIADMVRNLAGDRAEVISLMGPGVDPHFYKATQGDLKRLKDADIIFYNGLHLEGKMQSIFEKFARQKTVVAVSVDIPRSDLLLLSSEGDETLYDPHIWHSIELWKQIIPTITKTIIEKDKPHAKQYRGNKESVSKKLAALNDQIIKEVNTIPKQHRLLITSHDAFNYYGRNYNIEVKGLQGISTVAEIGIKDITKMVDLIISRKIKSVFVESSVNERNLKAVIEGCKKKGWEVNIGGTLFSDAMGKDGTVEGTYIGMIKHNTNAIIKALK